MIIQPILLEDGTPPPLDHRLKPQRSPDQSGSVEPHDVIIPTNKQQLSSTDNCTEASPSRLQPPHSLPNNNLNINWSPDTVLLRTRQHTHHTSCDIITGVPLLTNISKSPHPQQLIDNKKAPLLTMRDRRLKGASRLGFGGGAYSSSQFQTPCGYHLAGQHSSAGLLPRKIDSAYSRHCLIPIHQSSHTLIRPDSKLPSLEPKQDKL